MRATDSTAGVHHFWLTWKEYILFSLAFVTLQVILQPEAISFRTGGPPLEPFVWVWLLYTAIFLYRKKKRRLRA